MPASLLGELQRIGGDVEPTWLEALVTLVVVAVVASVRHAARTWNNSHDGHRAARLGFSGVAAVVTGLGVLVVLTVWDLLEPLRVSYAALGVENIAGNLLLAGVILAGAYALTSFVGRIFEEVVSTSGRISEHQKEIVFRITQLVLYSLATLTAIGLFTRNLGSLLVGAGFLGIVVGMAARQTLGSVLAGFVLMFSRPFELGDWVVVGEREGIVTNISIVNTRIQTFDGEYVMLPNDEVSSQPIVNRTRKGRLRIEVEVGVDYQDDPTHAATVAREAVSDLDEVMNVPTPQVVGKRFADSSVVLGIRFWIDNPSSRRKWRAQTAVISAVKSAFTDEGIKIPFPQRELMARTEEGGFRLAEEERPADAEPSNGGLRDDASSAAPDGGGEDRS